MKSKRIEFDSPPGFALPEGKAVGDDIEVMASVRVKPDGRLCLVELDGNRMPGYKEGDEDEPDGKTYAQAAADRMDAEMPGGRTGGY